MAKSTVPQKNPKDSIVGTEYQLAIDGYRYRDQLIPQEFASMLQGFVVFSALLAGSQTLAPTYPVLAFALSAIIAITGFVGLLAYAIDIESNTSCKDALRDHSTKLEDNDVTLEVWKTINNRDRFLLEKLISGQKHGAAAGTFVRASRLLLVLWIVVAAAVLFWGQVVLPR